MCLDLLATALLRSHDVTSRHKGPLIYYVSMILAVFYPPYLHVSVRKIFHTPAPYSYVRFHLVFQHYKMSLEKDQLH